MTPIVTFLIVSGLVVNGDALAITQKERSDNTIAVTGMNKMQAEAVKVIAEMVKRHAEKAAAGKLISHSISHADVPGVLESARAYLVDKRKQIRDYRKSQRANRTKDGTEKCGGWCIAGIIIDGAFILDNNKMLQCGPLVMIVWWVQGVVTLMLDQGLTFDDAVFMLVQQVTTIGYGSETPTTNGMKIWHALHSVVGVTMAAGPTDELFDGFSAQMIQAATKAAPDNPMAQRLAANLPLTLTIIASTFGYAFDLQHAGVSANYAQALLDSFYMTLFSLTTVGYGDVNPSTPVGKLLSLPVMMFGTRLFAKTYADDDSGDKEDGTPADEGKSLFETKCAGGAFLEQKLHTKSDQEAPA